MAGGTDGNLITYDASGDPAFVATGSATQVLTSNGAGAAPTFQAGGGGGGGFSTVFKTSDEVITSDTTLTDDADLVFSVDANSTYVGIMIVRLGGDAGTDYKEAFTIPAGATMTGLGDSTNIWNWGYSDSVSPSKDMTAVNVVEVSSGSSPRFIMTPFIIITAGTSGSIQYQWAQNISSVNDTTTFKGSWIQFIKVS